MNIRVLGTLLLLSTIILSACGGQENEPTGPLIVSEQITGFKILADGTPITPASYAGGTFRAMGARAGNLGTGFGVHTSGGGIRFNDDGTIHATVNGANEIFRLNSETGVYEGTTTPLEMLVDIDGYGDSGAGLALIYLEGAGEALVSFGFETPADSFPTMLTRYSDPDGARIYFPSPEQDGLVLVMDGLVDLSVDYASGSFEGTLFSGSRDLVSGEFVVNMELREGLFRPDTSRQLFGGRAAGIGAPPNIELTAMLDGQSLNPEVTDHVLFGNVYGNEAEAIGGGYYGRVQMDAEFGELNEKYSGVFLGQRIDE